MSRNWWQRKEFAVCVMCRCMGQDSTMKINCGYKQQQEWISTALLQVKEPRHKRLHDLWFNLYGLLLSTKLYDGNQISGCQEFGVVGGAWPQRCKRAVWGSMEILYTWLWWWLQWLQIFFKAHQMMSMCI